MSRSILFLIVVYIIGMVIVLLPWFYEVNVYMYALAYGSITLVGTLSKHYVDTVGNEFLFIVSTVVGLLYSSTVVWIMF